MPFHINIKNLPKNHLNDKAFLEKFREIAVQLQLQKLELMPYQAELIKLQKHIERYNKKLIILFDGRDGSGKGSTIRCMTRYMNTKHYRIEAVGRPSTSQKTELHMKRYIERFPHAGEIVFFDRSWYNRALVEPVLGFCTSAQYNKFIRNVNSYEKYFLEDDKTTLLKFYLSVSKSEQKKCFDRRKNDPLRAWKLSKTDLQAQKLWDQFTTNKYQMLHKTSSVKAPWLVVRSDDRFKARLEVIKLILNAIPYRGRSKKLDYSVNKKIVIPAEKELASMKKHRKNNG